MLRVTASRFTSPLLVELNAQAVAQRSSSSAIDHYEKFGAGGRNSFNGIVATVFGATGMLGKYVVGRLAAAGTQIIIPYRGIDLDTRHLRVMGELGQIKFMEYHLQDKESIKRAVTHSNVVINLVGRNFATRRFPFEEAMVTGAESIATAAKDAGAKRLIQVSHLCAAGNSPSQFLQAKARGERKVAEVFPDATIIRPSDIFGDEDKYLNKCAYTIRVCTKSPLGMPLVANGWDTIKRPVYVGDVAQAVLKTAVDNSTAGKTYEVYGPEAYYLADMVDYVHKTIRHRTALKTFHLPMPLMNLMGLAFEMSLWNPRFSREMAYMQFMNEEIDESALSIADLGITPTSLNTMGHEILRRHRHHSVYDELIEETEFCVPASQRVGML